MTNVADFEHKYAASSYIGEISAAIEELDKFAMLADRTAHAMALEGYKKIYEELMSKLEELKKSTPQDNGGIAVMACLVVAVATTRVVIAQRHFDSQMSTSMVLPSLRDKFFALYRAANMNATTEIPSAAQVVEEAKADADAEVTAEVKKTTETEVKDAIATISKAPEAVNYLVWLTGEQAGDVTTFPATKLINYLKDIFGVTEAKRENGLRPDAGYWQMLHQLQTMQATLQLPNGYAALGRMVELFLKQAKVMFTNNTALRRQMLLTVADAQNQSAEQTTDVAKRNVRS